MTHDASHERVDDDPQESRETGSSAPPSKSWHDDEVDTSRYSRKTRNLPHLEDDSGYEPKAVPLPKPVEEQSFFERLKGKLRG